MSYMSVLILDFIIILYYRATTLLTPDQRESLWKEIIKKPIEDKDNLTIDDLLDDNLIYFGKLLFI